MFFHSGSLCRWTLAERTLLFVMRKTVIVVYIIFIYIIHSHLNKCSFCKIHFISIKFLIGEKLTMYETPNDRIKRISDATIKKVN